MEQPSINQTEDIELSVEEAKASLGLSTRLSEQFLVSQMAMEQGMTEEGGEMTEPGQETPVEAPQDAPEAPESVVEPEVEEEPVEDPKDAEIESMRTDIELLKKLVIKE